MTILGIEEITYGASDLATCERFFRDWGLALVHSDDTRRVFECLNGCRVIVADPARCALPTPMEAGATLHEVVWGVASADELAAVAQRLQGQPGFVRGVFDGFERVGCTDPNGLAFKVQVSTKRAIDLASARFNTWAQKDRIDQRAPAYERAQPIEVGHVVFFVRDVAAGERFYQEMLGFAASDRYPGRGSFLRCAPEGGHHDLFLLQLPQGKPGLNHVAFTVRDIHEVFGGGLHFSRCGWDTQLGPGRHSISSAYFWYFKNPAGALCEYYANEDQLTAACQPRDFEPGPTLAEQGIAGVVVPSWYALLAPAGTPPALVQALAAEVNAQLAQPATREALAAQGLVLWTLSPELLGAHIRAETQQWARIIRDRKITAE